MTDYAPRQARAASASATGPLVPGPGVLYAARLTGAAGATAVLRDHASETTGGNVLLTLQIGTGLAADDWPRAPVALAYNRGVTVQITGTGTVTVAFDTR